MVQGSNGTISLERQAIEKARSEFAQLRGGSNLFQECIEQADTIDQLIKSIEQRYKHHRNKASSRLLEQFQRHTAWLQNLSSVIEVAVQSQAEILCPIWAPVKFILQISNFHSLVAEQITTMIQTISESLPRLEIYKKLQSDPSLQVALLNIFTDIVGFCVVVYRYFRRRTLVRIGKLLASPLKQEFQDTVDRLKSHAKVVDDTAVAVELLRASEFRSEMKQQKFEELRLSCEMWLKPLNMREVHQIKSQMKLSGTCEWIWSHDALKLWAGTQSTTTKDRLLCVSGKSGCGKSILASSIVENLRQQGRRTMFFSFSGTDASRQTLNSLVRSFVWQILQDLLQEAGYNIIRELMLRGQPVTVELWNALH